MLNKRTRYTPPAVLETASVELEECLLTASTVTGRILLIEGQQTDGYYESEDIGSVWGWD